MTLAQPLPATSEPPAGLPPGPRSRLLTTARVLARPFTWFPRWEQRYGDPYTVAAMNGTIVMTSRPEGIQQIFTADPDLFDVFAVDAILPLVGRGSLLVVSGPPHRRSRKLLAPSFNGKRMRAYGEVMAGAARRQAAAFGPGRRLVGLELGQAISLEVIIRAVFGVEEPERVAAFGRAIVALMSSLSSSFLFFRFLQRGWFPPWTRFLRRFAALDALLREQIARVREQGSAPEAIVSLLLQARDEEGRPMSDDELRDQLLTLLVAGHETTGIALAWALDWIHGTSGVRERILAELDDLGPDPDPDAIARLPYLDATVQESLRLRPLLTEVIRTLKADFELRGYRVPAGTSVAASVVGAHLRPETYPEPERFRPERFLERRYGAYEYLPYGGGTRRCLGAAFASYELKVVLGTLLRAWTLERVDPRPAVPARRNIVMAPRGGVPLRVVARR